MRWCTLEREGHRIQALRFEAVHLRRTIQVSYITRWVTSSAVLWMGLSIIGCARIHLVPEGKTIQQQCGVSTGQEVSKEQALCIARLGGLESGARPWIVKDESDVRANEGLWEVCNTTRIPTGQQEAAGTCWRISRENGRVVGIGPWERVTVN